MRRPNLVLTTLLGAAIAAPAAAQIRPDSIELSPYGGIWEGDGVLETGPTFGLRAGYNLNRVFGLEANYGLVPTTHHKIGSDVLRTELGSEDAMLQQFAVNGMLHLAAAALTPYMTAGAGFVAVDDVSFATNIGLGIKYHLTDLIALRTDFRGWFSGEAPAEDSYTHFEATLGVTFQLGGNYDLDGDGVPTKIDKCPTQPEDIDGFQDADGCPDPDNDGDGIPDAQDKCPNEPEDMDGMEDEDGCPDLDDDGDGILNEVDKCPKEPEDMDGFQDEDGCPDPDNDGDGIPDEKDKCPNEPETVNQYQDADGCPEKDTDGDGYFDDEDKCPNEAENFNGFQDDDGCPDTFPDALTEVLGIWPEARFAKGDKVLNKQIRGRLDAVAPVLVEHPKVKFELRATAHDVKDPDGLSAARAEAARDYLVQKGVAVSQLAARGLGAEPLPDGAPKGSRADRLELHVVVEKTAGR